MSAADSLASKLRRAFDGRPGLDLGLPAPELTARLAAVREALGEQRGRRSVSRLARGVMSLRLLGRRVAWPEVKYACHGVARRMDWEGRVILEDDHLLDELLRAVAALRATRPRRFAECCRGLQAAWRADVAGEEGGPEEPPAPGAARLQAFLHKNWGQTTFL